MVLPGAVLNYTTRPDAETEHKYATFAPLRLHAWRIALPMRDICGLLSLGMEPPWPPTETQYPRKEKPEGAHIGGGVSNACRLFVMRPLQVAYCVVLGFVSEDRL